MSNGQRIIDGMKEASAHEKLRTDVARAIGRVVWGAKVVPTGNWLVAADAALAAWSSAIMTPMTPEQAEEQRRSFVFGNTAIENENITREMVDKRRSRRK